MRHVDGRDDFKVSRNNTPRTLFTDRSEYDLLTSGGENFSLWKVDSAKAKEFAPRGSTPPKRKGTSVLVKKRTWLQPVNKVLFAPFGQVKWLVFRSGFECTVAEARAKTVPSVVFRRLVA